MTRRNPLVLARQLADAALVVITTGDCKVGRQWLNRAHRLAQGACYRGAGVESAWHAITNAVRAYESACTSKPRGTLRFKPGRSGKGWVLGRRGR